MTETPQMPEKNDERCERFLDELLDSALAQYAQAEPRPGLEGRLLARLRSQPEPAAFSWRWLPMAAAAAAVVVAVLYFAGSRQARRPEIAVQPQPAVAPAGTAQPGMPMAPSVASGPAASRPAVRQPSAPRAPAAVPAAARREQFPTPVALSEQEQFLVRLASQTPPQQLQALTRPRQEQPIQELRVEALEIRPVAVEGPDSQ